MANIDDTPTGNSGTYNTQIPDLDDNANIQTALRLYHYGSETIPANSAAITSSSIAGYLKTLNTQLELLEPETTGSIGNGQNLNNYVTSGKFNQDSDTDARSLNSLNYPLFSVNEDGTDGLAYAGLLTVLVAEDIVYQTYQMTSVNSFFFRTRSTSLVWSSWLRVANFLHNHDGRYYTETEINGFFGTVNDNINTKQDTISGAASTITTDNLPVDKVLISNSIGKVVSSTSITPTNLNLLSNAVEATGKSGIAPKLVFSDAPSFTGFPSANSGGTVTDPARSTTSNTLVTQKMMARDALTVKTTAVTNAGVFIQSTTPTSPSANDLWFW